MTNSTNSTDWLNSLTELPDLRAKAKPEPMSRKRIKGETHDFKPLKSFPPIQSPRKLIGEATPPVYRRFYRAALAKATYSLSHMIGQQPLNVGRISLFNTDWK